MYKVALIADPARKTKGNMMADMMFAKSPLYRYTMEYCRSRYDKIFILSAKYGVIIPDKKIEHYNVSLYELEDTDFRRWKCKVKKEITESIPEGSELNFFAGKKYCEIIPLLSAQYKCEIPLKGMGIGQALKFLREELGYVNEENIY